MKIPGEKTLLIFPVQNVLIIEIRNDTNLNFYTSLPRKGFMNLFREPKRSVKMKNLCHLLPLFGTTRVKTLIELPPYSISVSLILEAHKNRT